MPQQTTILLIEDDIPLRNEIEDFLSIYFDTIITANDGKEGLELYKQIQPNAIFSDINIPYISGLELIKQIRKNDQEIPIVIFSAHTNHEYLFQAIELKLVTYLVKPIETKKLQEAITRVLNKIKSSSIVCLNNDYNWDTKKLKLYYKKNEIELSSYEKILIDTLYQNKNNCVSYIDLSLAIYPEKEFSQNSLLSLVKRLRQKTSKTFIESYYMMGYKLLCE